MKKVSKLFIILILLVFMCGCEKEERIEEKKEDKEIKEEVIEEKVIDTYKDLNNTPIGIYLLKGNTLVKQNSITITPTPFKDVALFQLFPSSEETVVLNSGFGQAYHDEWIKYNNIKLGFNFKYTTNSGDSYSYNILSPYDMYTNDSFLMSYIYDDYVNMGKGWYSHLESDQYNQNSLFTSFKVQQSKSTGDINSKIQLSVFTYDSEDDFLEGEYRGNSIYTMNICIEGIEC